MQPFLPEKELKYIYKAANRTRTKNRTGTPRTKNGIRMELNANTRNKNGP